MPAITIFDSLTDMGWGDVFIIIVLCCSLIPAISKVKEELLKALGLESKRARLEREREEKIQSLLSTSSELKGKVEELEKHNTDKENRIKELEDKEKKLEQSADKFNKDRIHDREQSREIRSEMNDTIKAVSDKVDKLIDSVHDLKEENRKYQLDDIRETLLCSHRYYTSHLSNPMKAWTDLEYLSFKEQYSNYIARGGNGDMKDRVKPEMDRLNVVHMDDFEALSKLMASRNQYHMMGEEK